MAIYKDYGNVISVPIYNEYEIVILIKLIDKEKMEFRCNLAIRDIEADMTIGLSKTPNLISTYKTVKFDAAKNIRELISNGYFDSDVSAIKNLYDCMMRLRAITHKED